MGIKVNRQEAPEYEPMVPGEYRARVKELEEQEDGQYGPSVKLRFEILDDEDYDDRVISGFCPLKLDDEGDYTMWPGTKLWDWATALLGDVEPFDLEDLDDLVGKEARIVVVQKKKKDGNIGDKISEVLAPKKSKGKGKKKAETSDAASEAKTDAEVDEIAF
jgi:hypothetical protein